MMRAILDSTSQVLWSVLSNQAHHIAVDGFGGVSGGIELGYNFTPQLVHLLTLTSTAGGSVSPASGL